MPWQLITALALIGLDALYLAFQAVKLGAIAADLWAEPFGWLPLLLMSVVAVLATLCVVVGLCILARRNWARRLAVTVNFILVLFAVLALVFAGALGQFDVLALASGAFSLFMIFLLSAERSKAYTYRGGDDSWPED